MEIPWGAIVALGCYILGSTCGFIWWMATQTVKLESALENLVDIKKTLNMAEATYATKVEVAKDFTSRDKQIDALWNRFDSIKGG